MRISRKFAALGAAAALVVTAVPAGAAPTTGDPSASLPALADSLAPQLTSLVEALRRDLGLTPEQFLDQAGIGRRLAEAQPGWEATFREAFGGVWLDDSGTGRVGVVPGKVGDKLRKEATRAGFTVQDVALSTEELTERERQVAAIIADLPADLSTLITGVGIDPVRNAVVVTTRGGDAAQLGTLDARLRDVAEIDMTDAPDASTDTAPFGSQGGATRTGGGVALEGLTPAATGYGATTGGQTGSLGSLTLLNDLGVVPEGPARTIVELLAGLTPGTGSVIDGMNETVPNPRPQARTLGPAAVPAPSAPVPGGTAYSVRVPAGVLECSTGFNGELDGEPVVVTAAHCAGGDGARASFADGVEFGTMTGITREGIDTALIAVDETFADRFSNNLVGSADDTTQSIIGTARPVVGQKACKTGFRTGFSCGTISQVGATIDVAGSRVISDAFTVDLCALPGDSGGVVFSGDRALGISSASNVADAGNCADAETIAEKSGFTPRLSAVPIDGVLAAHPGLTLRTR